MKHFSHGNVKIPIIPAHAVPVFSFFCFYVHVALIKKERKKEEATKYGDTIHKLIRKISHFNFFDVTLREVSNVLVN